jgi:hypothetical protein
MIYLAWLGNGPLFFQPSIFKRNREMPRKNDFKPGVMNLPAASCGVS